MPKAGRLGNGGQLRNASTSRIHLDNHRGQRGLSTSGVVVEQAIILSGQAFLF